MNNPGDNQNSSGQEAGRNFRLLELIHENGTLTQRELSRRMNIALGLVNLSLKRLMRQELVKVRKLSARRVCYLLTPTGMVEKGRLSARYLSDSFATYRNARKALLNRLKQLRAAGVSRVVLYGDGPVAEAAFLTITELGMTLVAVSGASKTFLGQPPTVLADLSPEGVDKVLFAGQTAQTTDCLTEMKTAGMDSAMLEDLTQTLLKEDA